MYDLMTVNKTEKKYWQLRSIYGYLMEFRENLSGKVKPTV